MSGRYIITTPQNPEYSGVVAGVRIDNGRGILDSNTINPKLKKTVEQALVELANLGPQYLVTPVQGYDDAPAPQAPAEEPPTAEAKKGGKATGYQKVAE